MGSLCRCVPPRFLHLLAQSSIICSEALDPMAGVEYSRQVEDPVSFNAATIQSQDAESERPAHYDYRAIRQLMDS